MFQPIDNQQKIVFNWFLIGHWVIAEYDGDSQTK